MNRRKIHAPILIGMILILCSFGLAVALQIHIYVSSEENQRVTDQICQLLPGATPGIRDSYADTRMPVVEIDGADYIGLLEIPGFDVQVSVSDQWSGGVLSSSIGRFSGSAYDHTLVIGGPDYPGLFDFCDDIDVGSSVILTDMTGAQFSYTVSRIDRASAAQADWLKTNEYDLTLFCRDLYSMEYIAVRCKLNFN